MFLGRLNQSRPLRCGRGKFFLAGTGLGQSAAGAVEQFEAAGTSSFLEPGAGMQTQDGRNPQKLFVR